MHMGREGYRTVWVQERAYILNLGIVFLLKKRKKENHMHTCTHSHLHSKVSLCSHSAEPLALWLI